MSDKSKMYLSDNVGADGTIYPSVGEHIRNAKSETVTSDAIVSAMKSNTDIIKVSEAIDVSSEDLLSGQPANFGGLDCQPLTAEQKAKIVAYLGIS